MTVQLQHLIHEGRSPKTKRAGTLTHRHCSTVMLNRACLITTRIRRMAGNMSCPQQKQQIPLCFSTLTQALLGQINPSLRHFPSFRVPRRLHQLLLQLQ